MGRQGHGGRAGVPRTDIGDYAQTLFWTGNEEIWRGILLQHCGLCTFSNIPRGRRGRTIWFFVTDHIPKRYMNADIRN